jgi:hypothetical protein
MIPRLKLSAAISLNPAPHELWTLRHMSFVACDLSVAYEAQAGILLLGAGGAAALDEYFDCDDLRAWWARSAITATTDSSAQDVVVRILGGKPGPRALPRPRIAALTVRHGKGSACIVDEGADSQRVLWRGAPQLAPGDASLDLFFRAHLEATKALVQILRTYALSPEGVAC